MFSYDDHGVNRLIFFAKEYSDVDNLLDLIEGGNYCFEFMTRDPLEFIPSYAQRYASMKRVANTDCRTVFDARSEVIPYKGSAAVEMAGAEDTEEINRILWSTFHTEMSHLLTDEELCKKIVAGQLTVHRNQDNKIDALLQADVMPKKFYINQIVNRTEKNVIHALLLDRLEKYIDAGGKYVYAWIEDKNIASLKFHEKYGMKHDGMWSMIYCLER